MSSEQNSIVRQVVEHLNCPTEGYIRIATNADVENIFHFINNAYFKPCCTYRSKGFENRFLNVEEMCNFMNNGIFLLLIASDREKLEIFNDECSIIACIFINHLGTDECTKQMIDGKLSVKINLLTVHPKMQGHGIARYMMQVVEGMAKCFGYTHIWITVVSIEKHLLDMYSKWGFHIIGTKTIAELGLRPERYNPSIYFVTMEKEI